MARKSSMPPNVANHLAALQELERNRRIKLGECFTQMRECVEKGEGGINPITGKPWTWAEWAKVFLKENKHEINRCITSYKESLN